MYGDRIGRAAGFGAQAQGSHATVAYYRHGLDADPIDCQRCHAQIAQVVEMDALL